jgi:glycosyltransferase involved in cell wall biosynthesis
LIERLSGRFDVTGYATVGPDGYDRTFSCGDATIQFVRARQEDHLVRMTGAFLHAFRKDHKTKPYNLVHGFWAIPGGIAAVGAGKLAGIPSVVSLLGGESASIPGIGYGNMASAAPRAATLWTCRSADALTFLTEYQRRELRRFAFTRMHGVSVIPFGAEPALFPYTGKRRPKPPYHVLHIGHLNKVKDQGTLLNAFKRMRDHAECRLRIVGEDTLEGSMQRLAGELGIASDVTFEGLVAHDALRHHFAWSDLLLHTSLYEGEGVVYAEAASSGVPICGTQVGLLADLGRSFSVSVSPGDHEALAREALNLLHDPVHMQSLRANARAWAAEHTADWSADQFAELYTSTLTAPSIRRGSNMSLTTDSSRRAAFSPGPFARSSQKRPEGVLRVHPA